MWKALIKAVTTHVPRNSPPKAVKLNPVTGPLPWVWYAGQASGIGRFYWSLLTYLLHDRVLLKTPKRLLFFCEISLYWRSLYDKANILYSCSEAKSFYWGWEGINIHCAIDVVNERSSKERSLDFGGTSECWIPLWPRFPCSSLYLSQNANIKVSLIHITDPSEERDTIFSCGYQSFWWGHLTTGVPEK